MSTWCATERYGLAVVPGSLALVQDFLNTRSIMGGQPDLLTTLASTQKWCETAVSAWTAARCMNVLTPTIAGRDPSKLRDLRAVISDRLAGELPEAPNPLPGLASFEIDDTGQVRWQPTGNGWTWVSSALWGEITLAQASGAWSRLKQCRNPECQSAFYDRSKNNSAVWHDVKVCGNAINLRASRARRRAAHPQ
jgi:hypothetical protein